MDFVEIFRTLGLSQKEATIYLESLKRGPASVRVLSQATGIQRATTYDVLKSLMGRGLISYYHKATKQFFVAEDPEKLLGMVEEHKRQLDDTKTAIVQSLPELRSMIDRAGEKPVVRYYEGDSGIKTVLTDVLDTVSHELDKTYFVYSSAEIRPLVYRAFSDYTKERIAKKIHVRVIALGEGGEDQEYAQRKWIKSHSHAPTYQILYADKIAYITQKYTTPVGVVIEDQAIAQSAHLLFEALWKTL